MAIFYIDLLNGNDSNDGTTWANAWRTLTSGPTAARIAPGDTFRVAKSPDPVSLGSSTWTDGAIGGSIVFDSAITKEVDRCKAGWVTMGAGSTVTNAQTTAWVTQADDNAGKALQWVTSAATNGCYKNLGSTQDFSGFRILNFWLRVSGTFDCTSSQDMVVEFCSDAAATTVVNSITIPKISYGASLWYPIVADFGAALSSTVRSVRIRTAVATTLTFQVDEMFTSQAGGLTLRSLIGNSSTTADWFPIRTVRSGTDVHLMARFSPSTAQSASGTAAVLGASWRGTTGTYTAHKRDTILVPTTSANFPGNIENGTNSGTTVFPFTYSGGWNTSTTEQDGETWIDGLVQNAGNFALGNTSFHNHWRIENFGFVRTSGGTTACAGNLINNCSFVACGSVSFGVNIWNVYGWTNMPTSFTLKCVNGCGSLVVNTPSVGSIGTCTYTIGNCWGNDTLTLGGMPFRDINIGTISPATTGAAITMAGNAYRTVLNIEAIKVVKTVQSPTGMAFSSIFSSWGSIDSILNLPYSECVGTAFIASPGSGSNGSVFNIGTNTGSAVLIGSFSHEIIFNNLTVGTSGGLFASSTINSQMTNQKMYFHNYGGVLGASRVYVTTGSGNNAALGLFELQGTDVYTSGSKAWKYSVSGMPAINGSNVATIGAVNDLKLAAVAAEADKLVTVTCRVKRSASVQEVGIKLSGKYKLVPGYTDDVLTTCSSTGTFELLTVTFTPTEDCVFDIMAHVKLNDATSLEAVWDDLQITQAA